MELAQEEQKATKKILTYDLKKLQKLCDLSLLQVWRQL